MNLSFGKFYAKTFTGSMYGAGANVLAVWGYCIANAQPPKGLVELNPKMLSPMIGMTVEDVEKSILFLCSPDLNSRTKEEEGRRLVHVAGFEYRLVNFAAHRGFVANADRQEYRRRWDRENRGSRPNAKYRETPPTPPTPPTVGHASASPSVREGGTGGSGIELPHGFPKTADDAITQAAFAGCDPVFATSVWNKAMGRGGNDSRDVPIRSFRHHLATEWAFEQDRRKRPNGHAGKLFPRDIKLQMDAVQKDIDTHPANRESAAYCGRPTQLQLASLAALRKRLKELNSQLSGYIPNA